MGIQWLGEVRKSSKQEIEDAERAQWNRFYKKRQNYQIVLLNELNTLKLERTAIDSISQAHQELGIPVNKIEIVHQSSEIYRDISRIHTDSCLHFSIDHNNFFSSLKQYEQNLEKIIVTFSPAFADRSGNSDFYFGPIGLYYWTAVKKYGEDSIFNILKHEVGHLLLRWGHHNDDPRDYDEWQKKSIDSSCIMATNTSITGKRDFCSLCKSRGKEVLKKDALYLEK
jgi:hypothetical protein